MIRIFKLHLENFNLKIYCNFVFEYGCFFPFANNALLQLQIELPLCSFGQVIKEGRAVCGFDWPARQAYCLNKPCLLQLSSEESMCCYHLLPLCNVRNRNNWHSNVVSKEWLRQSPYTFSLFLCTRFRSLLLKILSKLRSRKVYCIFVLVFL